MQMSPDDLAKGTGGTEPSEAFGHNLSSFMTQFLNNVQQSGSASAVRGFRVQTAENCESFEQMPQRNDGNG